MNDEQKLMRFFSIAFRYGLIYPVKIMFGLPIDIMRLLLGTRLVWPRLVQMLVAAFTWAMIGWIYYHGAPTLGLPSHPKSGPRNTHKAARGPSQAFRQEEFFPLLLPLAVGVIFHRLAKHGESPFGKLMAAKPSNPFNRSRQSAPGEIVVRGAVVHDRGNRKQTAADINFGKQTIVRGSECQHFLISGRTGAGKSQAIYAMLSAVVARGEPAMIADPGGGYLARYGGPGALVLNPLDPRDAGWNPFNEIEQDYDCDRLAKAIIPDAEGESRQWHFYAQTLVAAVLRRMHQTGQNSVAELLRVLTSADQTELALVVAGTAAESMAAKSAERMLGSTRAIISTYLAAWRYLPENGTFSVRKWVRGAASGSAPWLFTTYRDDQMALLRLLIACWLDLAIVELLSQPEQPERRVWFIADELDSLGKVGAMRDGLTKLRKYGGSVVAGLQTVAQLRSTYGRDEAQVLLSCLSTKLILAAGDAETAKYFEEQIGQQEVERKSASWGRSAGDSGGSKSSNVQQQRHLQAAVLASEITSLPDLQGFLQVPSGTVARVQLTYQAQKKTA